MNKILKPLTLLLCILDSSFANAGDLLNSATITSITNVGANQDRFVVYFTGGTGVCSDNKFIKFPMDAAVSKEAHARAFSLAMTALTTGMKVRFHNYENNSCDRASYIQISK